MDFTSDTYLIAQLFGLIGMLVAIFSQQFKGRKPILLCFIVANLLNAIHFFLLSAMTGVVLAVIGAVRFFVSMFSIKKAWLVFFLIVNTLVLPFVFEGWLLSGTAYLAATFIIISTFLESDHAMRIAIIIGASGWLLYGVLIESIIEVVANAFFLISSILGWYRHVYSAKKA
jgi:hypothetical protein